MSPFSKYVVAESDDFAKRCVILKPRGKKMRKSVHKKASVQNRGEKMSFTAVFLKVPEGYVGFIEELPGANTQGATLNETRANLKEAVRLVLEANKKLVECEIADKKAIREKIEIPFL